MAWTVGTHLPMGPFKQINDLGVDALNGLLAESAQRGLLLHEHAEDLVHWLTSEYEWHRES